MPEDQLRKHVDEFILGRIRTVPHLEALLLVWNKRPNTWTAEQMSRALYIPAELADSILHDLSAQGLIRESAESPGIYDYQSSSREQDSLLAAVDTTYRRELIRVTRMIHSKTPSALQEFARAFRITKDKGKD